MNQLFEEQLKLLKIQYQQKLPALLNDIVRLYNQLATTPDTIQEELLRQIHSIKGSSGTYGFAQVAQSSEHIELLLREFYSQHSPRPPQLIEQLREAMTQLHQAIRLASKQSIETRKTEVVAVKRAKSLGTDADILLLEDELIQSEMLRKNLAEFGYRIRVCLNLRELDAELSKQKPDLFVI